MSNRYYHGKLNECILTDDEVTCLRSSILDLNNIIGDVDNIYSIVEKNVVFNHDDDDSPYDEYIDGLYTETENIIYSIGNMKGIIGSILASENKHYNLW